MAKFSLVVAFVFLAHLSLAQNSPQDYLNAHNTARSEVGVSAIIWDNNLATWAQNYINTLKSRCRLVHSGGPYGENLAGSLGDMSGITAVDQWVAESFFYDKNYRFCSGLTCKHYTQVVWRNSIRLGCAKVRCDDGGTIISCNYDPPGNIIGEDPY